MIFYDRKNPRANRYDYSSDGIYFVTICAKYHIRYFGEIKNDEMMLNNVGKICNDELHTMLSKRPLVDLHEYVIMPNHVHLLLSVDHHGRDTGLPCPTYGGLSGPVRTLQASVPTKITNQHLGSIIGGWKSATTKHCNEKGLIFAWQNRYHDHIVRNEIEYENIKNYIINNPKKWAEDKFYKS